jgi:ice-binding like protein
MTSGRSRDTRVGATMRRTGLLVLALLATLAFAGSAQAQAPVGLGTADSFAILAGSEATNTGPSVVNGNLGVSPGNTCPGFFPCDGGPGQVNGTVHLGPTSPAAQAQADLIVAYNDAAGRPCSPTNNFTSAPTLGGRTLTAGVYCFDADADLTGPLTLNAQGNPDAVWIFQIGAQLTTATGSSVNLIGGAQACNVFWQVGSTAVLTGSSVFAGNILALTSITVGDAVTVNGRLLARNGNVTLINDTINRAQCAAGNGGGGGGGGGGDGGGGPGGGPGAGPGAGGPGAGGPNVQITGAPGDGITGNPVSSPGGRRKPCIPVDFRLRIRARDPDGIRRVTVFLDGERIKRTTRGRFLVWIRAARLDAGRHTIRVVAVDRDGNRRVKERTFKRCARPAVPVFTG